MKIGIIAEDDSDVQVMVEITNKIIGRRKFKVKKFVGRGCGKLRRKCGAWARDLKTKGCDLLVVVHDLDRMSERVIRDCITKQIKDVCFRDKIIIVPVEELEAWLLADPAAIKSAFSIQKPVRIPSNPEKINNPKEFIGKLVWQHTKRRYIHTIHNLAIAKNVRIRQLEVCNSFTPYPEFLNSNFN